MLQRTQAPQAARIFADFLSRYPTAASVAEADPIVIEDILAGLGLRHRARRVIALCRALVERHGGRVPDDSGSLDALPGVGPYSVGAVLCFAFGRDTAIVDRNIVRVLTRLVGYTPSATRPHTDRGLWALALSLVPHGRAREYNLALLDLAASICTARHPRHDVCPLADLCHYYRMHAADIEAAEMREKQV